MKTPTSPSSALSLLGVGAIVLIVGSSVVVAAATSYVSHEIESLPISGSASSVIDSSASGGGQFCLA